VRGPFRVGVDLALMVQSTLRIDETIGARLDWIAGSALYVAGRSAEARAQFESALTRARATGDRRSAAPYRITSAAAAARAAARPTPTAG